MKSSGCLFIVFLACGAVVSQSWSASVSLVERLSLSCGTECENVVLYSRKALVGGTSHVGVIFIHLGGKGLRQVGCSNFASKTRSYIGIKVFGA